jgi:hypothetical protein
MEPNSISPALQALLAQRTTAMAMTQPANPINPINPDAVAALILSLLADPSGRIVPAEAYKLLAARNEALINAPADEVKAILARQVTVLEAVMLKYMTAAAAESSLKRAEPLARIGLSAQRALIATLGAIHAVSERDV